MRASPARQRLTPDGRLRPSPGDRCPVCAMSIDDGKKLASAIELQDGAAYYFCGTSCLLKAYLRPDVHLHVAKQDVKRVMTRDYFSGSPLDASAAIWVAGSDVVGPMGPAIVPLASEADASVFKARHGGSREFRLEQLSPELWDALQSARGKQ